VRCVSNARFLYKAPSCPPSFPPSLPTSSARNEMTLEGEGPLLLLLLLLLLLEEAFEAPEEEEEVTVLGEAREERTSLPALFQAACFSSARTRSLRQDGGREGGKEK